MLGAIINYLTRSTLAVAAPTLLKDLNITAQEYSYITATFQGVWVGDARRPHDQQGLLWQREIRDGELSY